MKTICWLWVVLIFSLWLPGAPKAQEMAIGLAGKDQRKAVGVPEIFNNDWDFHKGDIANGILAVESEKDWRKLNLPHDWSIEGPFSEEWASATAYLPSGIAWYKKTFKMDRHWKGKQIQIYFDGVYKNSEVWINGHFLGKRPNGFIPFYYDLTPYLKSRGENTIAVKVDHREFADSRWYTGSGIYRNVYLIVQNPVHIGLWDVAFSTPKVSKEAATVKVKVNVTSLAKEAENITVQVKMRPFNEALFSHNEISKTNSRPNDVFIQKELTVRPGKGDVQFEQQISRPALWGTDTPNLYQLEVILLQQGKVVDQLRQLVGIREIRFDKDKGFFLNGENMKLKGVCLHDDAGALGVAVPSAVWARRLTILKEAGVNAVRMSHNPHADYFYDLCDRMGLLVMDEAFDEWEIGKNKWVSGWNAGVPAKYGYHEYFDKWADKDIQAMVKRGRNHPCIILWSIGNEVDYPNDPYTHEVLNTGRNPQIYGKGFLPDHPSAKQIIPIAERLVRDVKAIDTTRPVTAALAGVVMSNEVGYPEVLDVVGYNYQEFRYAEDHAKYPNRIIYGSENGMSPAAWNAVDSNSYISGQFLWTGIDYLGEAGKWPERSNGAGLLDLAGFKKPGYYFRQSLWSDKPMAYLVTQVIPDSAVGVQVTGRRHRQRPEPVWNYPAGTKVKVACYTNCQQAELFLNGRSMGKVPHHSRDRQGDIPTWDLEYMAGALTVVGYNNGVAVSKMVLHTPGEAYGLKTREVVSQQSLIEGDLSQIEINIVDRAGNLVYKADSEITVSIKGRAKLLGLESGSSSSHESYQADHRKALHGKLLAYIQFTDKPGKKRSRKIKVTCSSPGLKPVTIQLAGK